MQSLRKPIVIVGLGKTGLACLRFLISKGYEPFVVDTRRTPPCLQEAKKLIASEKIQLGEFEQQFFEKAGTLVVSPGVSLKTDVIQNAIEKGVEVIGDIEIFAKYAEAEVIAITGSNGKSTVTDLLTQLLVCAGKKVEMGGNIGIPALELLQKKIPDYYVLELSSFQLETTQTLAPKVAVVLNISPDHMDRYQSMNEYRDAKLSVFRHSENCVVPTNNQWGLDKEKNIVEFGFEKTLNLNITQYKQKDWILIDNEPWLACSELQIFGQHNWLNILAVLTLLSVLEIPLDDLIKEGLKNYKGLSHRCELVAQKQGILWINDSKATNPGSTQAALNGFKNDYSHRIVLIAGGDAKGADLSCLSQPINKLLAGLITLGKDGDKIQALAEQSLPSVSVENMQEAVEAALEMLAGDDVLANGGIVLLSPACASLDMYVNFEDRGRAFCKAVEGLAA